jgi:Restriction endonuclease fold toxin 3
MGPRVDITPETVNTAARNFAVGQQDLVNAYQRLSQRLAGHSSGMAGDDKAAHQFAAVYASAGQAAYRAFHTAIAALGGTSLGLTQTVNNHLAADHHSRADKPGGPPPRYPPHQVSTTFRADGSPPVVTGANWAPSTTLPRLRIKVPHLPKWLEAIIGASPDWPQGNDHMLDEAGNAWHDAAEEIGKVASWLNWTISTILDPAENDEYTAVGNYWATLYKPADSSTVLSGLSTLCQGIANACRDYAAATRKATDIVAVETILEIIALLGAEVAGRLIGRMLRPVLSRVGAYMLRAVVRIGTRYGIREAEAEVIRAAANTKTVKEVEADFGKTAGRKLGSDITEKAGHQYSGPLIKVPKPDADADALARRIGGQSTVKFENDLVGREFDAVSDEYIGQAKPADYVFNERGRKQAKASFEAAQQTGRAVYYHFNGPPDQSVIAKLNEYSQRYGVRVAVDTKPF